MNLYRAKWNYEKQLDVDVLHTDVWNIFPCLGRNERKFVYRFGVENGNSYVVTLSEVMPLISVPFLALVGDVTTVRNEFESGSMLQFRLNVNPMESVTGKKNRRVVSMDEMLSWLCGKAFLESKPWGGEMGANIVGCDIGNPVNFVSKGHVVVGYPVKGELQVDDEKIFAEKVRRGVGDAKDLGFGMVDLW